MNEIEVVIAVRKLLKENNWTCDVRPYTHPSDNAVTVTLYRIKVKEQ